MSKRLLLYLAALLALIVFSIAAVVFGFTSLAVFILFTWIVVREYVYFKESGMHLHNMERMQDTICDLRETLTEIRKFCGQLRNEIIHLKRDINARA